jgi:hypothetical protein
MKPTVTIGGTDKTAKLRAQLAKLARKQVFVGVPEDETARKSGRVTNAGLVYLHTNGSPLRGIPARPIIEPAIQAADNSRLITDELGEAASAVLSEQPASAGQHLERAGTLAANSAKRWFTDPRNGWAPNSPLTIHRKGSDRPLINTAQMRRSITYLVEDK